MPPTEPVAPAWIKEHMARSMPGRTVPEAAISAALRRLVDAGLVRKGGNSWAKTEQGLHRFDEAAAELRRITEKVYSELLELASARIPRLTEEQGRSILHDYRVFVATLFTDYGFRAAELIFSTYREGVPLKLPRLDLVFHKARRSYGSLGSRYADHLRDEVLWEYISHPNVHQSVFWYVSAQSYLLDRLIKADPTSALSLRAYLEQRVVFLDTNIVYALVLRGHHLHSEVKELIEQSRELGVSLRVTTQTHDELHSLLVGKYHEHAGIRVPTPDETERLLAANLDDDYFNSFLLNLTNEPFLTWEDFSSRMVAGANLFEILGNELGLDVVDGGLGAYPSEEEQERLIRIALASGSRRRSRPKTRASAEHDVYHYLLVNYLRSLEEVDLLGTRYWFLTFESSLFRFDSKARVEVPNSNPVPFCLTWDVWAQSILLPFVAPQTNVEHSAELFANLVVSELLGTVAHDRVTADKLRVILNSAEITGMEPGLVGRFIASEFVEGLVERASPEYSRVEPELVKLALHDFQERETAAAYESHLARVAAELEQSRVELQTLAKEVAEKDEHIANLAKKLEANVTTRVSDTARVKQYVKGTAAGAGAGAIVGWAIPGLAIGALVGLIVGALFGLLFSNTSRK